MDHWHHMENIEAFANILRMVERSFDGRLVFAVHKSEL